MQPGVSPSGSFAGLIISTWRNRHLIARMIQREIVGRYDVWFGGQPGANAQFRLLFSDMGSPAA